MESWFSYSLSDFLLFSSDSYYRLFELANVEIWPAQLLLLAVAGSLLWTQFHPRPRSAKWITLVLASFWTLAGLLFMHRQYAQINPWAEWLALAFLVQALMFFICHLSEIWRLRWFDTGEVSWRHAGVLLSGYAIVVHPLVGITAGRSWQGAEMAGIAPDATALLTIGVLLSGSLKVNWLCLLLPFAWLLVSALTYLAMQQWHGLMPLLASTIALVVTLAGRKTAAQTSS